MRVAVISDIHGNALALEAVLEDIAGQGADAILNLGDHFAGPIEPVRTAEILAGLDMIAIRGNTDRYLLEMPDGLDAYDRMTVEAMVPQTRDWLQSLPETAQFEDQIFLSHGTPGSDEIYWLDRPDASGDFRASTRAEVEAELPALDFPVFCCGHTHVARVVELSDARIVFNPGSVGRPSFTMADPQSAARLSPNAAYALLTRSSGKWSVDLRQVAYDHAASAAIARANGGKKWARHLAEGRQR